MALALFFIPVCAQAQVSLATVVDLALRNSPRVKMAQADVERANAAIAVSRDAYVPTITMGSGLGYTYGFPVGQPTLYNFTSQSLLFDISQHNYIRAAKAGLQASQASLLDARQQVMEDAVISYVGLDRDLQQESILSGEYTAAQKLAEIVQQRLDAGLDPKMDLTKAKLSSAQIHLKQLHLNTDIAAQRDHLARLTGLPSGDIVTQTASIPASLSVPARDLSFVSPAVQAAEANARSKQQQAFGDKRQVYRPQIAFAAQYARYASFNNYAKYYGNGTNDFQLNNAAIGMQMVWPLFDRVRSQKAKISIAEATHAARDAEIARNAAAEGNLKLDHTILELAARQDVALLDRELAQEQLDTVLVQLNGGNGNTDAPQISPKDEQNARMAERQKAFELLDMDFELRQAQVSLLRAMGELEGWIKSASASAAPAVTGIQP